MPRGPKLVLAIQMIGVGAGVIFSFARPDTGGAVSLVIQAAILTGLFTRQTAAWLAARWLSGFAAVVLSLVVLLIIPGLFAADHTTPPWRWVLLALYTALEWLFFSLLGRLDSRVYFHAPRKA